jgi:regulator of sigma E protease
MSVLKSLTAIFHYIPTIYAWLFSLGVGILGIGFLIGFHELGHFLFAKLFNIRTPSFSIGFGPRLLSRTIGDTNFSLSAIPLGGYVELAGSAEIGQGEQKEAYATDERSFIVKPYYQKLLVMSGGIVFNLAFGYIAFFLLFLTGIPKSPYLYPLNASTTIESIKQDSVAQKAGLQEQDRIIALNNIDYTDNPLGFLKAALSSHAPVTVSIERDGTVQDVTLTIEPHAEQKGIHSLGIQFVEKLPQLSVWHAFQRSVYVTNLFIIGTLKGFKNIFWKRDVRNMAGPITIIAETIKGAGQGFKTVLIFLAIISINLAILNLIPVPILDGGQILFYTIEAIVGRSLPATVREYIFIASWLLFLALFVYLSYQDILKLLFR